LVNPAPTSGRCVDLGVKQDGPSDPKARVGSTNRKRRLVAIVTPALIGEAWRRNAVYEVPGVAGAEVVFPDADRVAGERRMVRAVHVMSARAGEAG
jgi:hypothetical protein